MRVKTQYYTAASLDGFIATPDDSLEWLFPLGDVAATRYSDFIRHVGALAMGSATYEWMLRHVVNPGGKPPQPWPYAQPTWVFSSRPLAPVTGADMRFVRGDVRPVHEEMVAAAGGKNRWIVGGGELAGQFYDHDLLDAVPELRQAVRVPLATQDGLQDGHAGLAGDVADDLGELDMQLCEGFLPVLDVSASIRNQHLPLSGEPFMISSGCGCGVTAPGPLPAGRSVSYI